MQQPRIIIVDSAGGSALPYARLVARLQPLEVPEQQARHSGLRYGSGKLLARLLSVPLPAFPVRSLWRGLTFAEILHLPCCRRKMIEPCTPPPP